MMDQLGCSFIELEDCMAGLDHGCGVLGGWVV